MDSTGHDETVPDLTTALRHVRAQFPRSLFCFYSQVHTSSTLYLIYKAFFLLFDSSMYKLLWLTLKYYRYGPYRYFQSRSPSFIRNHSLSNTEPITPTTSHLLLYVSVNYRLWLLLSHCKYIIVLNWSQIEACFSMTQVVTTETP